MKSNQKPTAFQKSTLAGITTRIRGNGQVRYQVYVGRDDKGKQRYKTFADKQKAETFKSKLDVAKDNEGKQLWSLTPDQRTEAKRCYNILTP